jgi:hypothetical protein
MQCNSFAENVAKRILQVSRQHTLFQNVVKLLLRASTLQAAVDILRKRDKTALR